MAHAGVASRRLRHITDALHVRPRVLTSLAPFLYIVVYDSPHLSNVIRQRAKIFVMCSVSFVTRETFLLSTSHVEQVGEMHDSARSDVGAVTTMQAQAAAAKQKPVGPTAVETYLFDLQGFLLLPAVLSPREVVALRTRLYELSVAL